MRSGGVRPPGRVPCGRPAPARLRLSRVRGAPRRDPPPRTLGESENQQPSAFGRLQQLFARRHEKWLRRDSGGALDDEGDDGQRPARVPLSPPGSARRTEQVQRPAVRRGQPVSDFDRGPVASAPPKGTATGPTPRSCSAPATTTATSQGASRQTSARSPGGSPVDRSAPGASRRRRSSNVLLL